MPIAANATINFVIQATLKNQAQLTALGINPLNGHIVTAQGTTTIGAKTTKTDDPNQVGTDNTTPFAITVLSDFTTSTKTAADMSIDTPLLPGDNVLFTFTLKNTGPGPGTINLSDTLAGELDFVSSPDPEIKFAAGTVQALNVTVAPGATKTLTFIAKIKPATAPGATFFNSASINPSDGNPPTIVQTPTLTVQGGPDLTSSVLTVVDSNGGDVEPGDTLVYTATLTNTGKLASGALQVSAAVDKNLDSVGAIDNGGTFDAGTNSVLWNLPTIAAGATIKITFSAKVKLGTINGTNLTVIGTIAGAELAKPVQISSTIKVQAQPNISLFSDTVASSSGSFKPSDLITYTVQLQNTGNGAVTNGVLTTTVDPLIAVQSASNGGVVNGQTITWKFPSLLKGDPLQSLTFQGKLAASVAQGKTVSNQLTLTGDGLAAPVVSDDPAKPGKTDPTVFAVLSAPDMSGTTKKYVDLNGGIVQGGDQIEYRIQLKNTGNGPATNVVVTDVLALQLTNVVVINGTFNAVNRTVTWNAVVSVAPGETPAELVLSAVIDKATPSGTIVNNQAKFTFTETPGSGVTNTTSFSVQNLPDFGLSLKAVSAPVITAGGQVSYALTIVNSGNAPGTGIVVSDQLPKEIENVLAPGGVIDATGKVTWNLGAMAAGATKALTVSGSLKKPLDKGIKVCNQALITASENPAASQTSPPGVAPKQGGEPTCFDVDSAVKLVLTKDVFDVGTGKQINQATIKPNVALRYSLKVKNVGSAVAKNVAVTDSVPPELTNIVPLDGGVFDAVQKKIVWPVTTLSTGINDEFVVRFEAKIAVGLDNGVPISNQGQVVFEGNATPNKSDDPTTIAVGDPTTVSIASSVDFSKASLTAVDLNGGLAQPSDIFEFTLKLQNDGDGTGKNVTINLPIDARLIAQPPFSDGAVLAGGVLTWKLGNMAPTDAKTLKFKVVLVKPQIDGALILEQAQISATGFGVPVLSDANLATAIKEPTQIAVSANANFATSSMTYVDVNGGAIEPGDEIFIKLTVRNTGDAIAQNLLLQALLQAGTLSDIAPLDGGQLLGDKVAWTLPSLLLSPTGDQTVTFKAKIAANVADGVKITVVGQVPTIAPLSVVLTVVAKPKLDTSTVVAEDETGWLGKVNQVAPGHVVRIEVAVKNTGKAAAENVVVSVPLPTKLGKIQIVTPGGAVNGQNAQWTLPLLAAGGSATVVLKATVAADGQDGEVLPITANLAVAVLPLPVAVKGPTLVIALRPIIKLTKTFEDLNGNHLFPGDGLRFAVTASNVGNAPATALQITDAVPAALTGLTTDNSGKVAGNIATWTIPTLAIGQAVTVNVQGKVAAIAGNGSAIVNTAQAKAQNSELTTSNTVTAKISYPTLAVAVILTPEALTKSPIQPGDTVTMQVVVTDNSPENASNVTVLAPIDTNAFDIVTLGGGQYDSTAKIVKWSVKDNAALANIPAGASVGLTVGLRVKATAKNGSNAIASATAREGETNLPYDSNVVQMPIVSVPQMAIKKTVIDLNGFAAGGKVHPLDTLRYQIEIGVSGNAAAQDVIVQDVLDLRRRFGRGWAKRQRRRRRGDLEQREHPRIADDSAGQTLDLATGRPRQSHRGRWHENCQSSSSPSRWINRQSAVR